MTAKEAITMLRRIQEPEPWEPQINEAAFEALQMAIEALGKDTDDPSNVPDMNVGDINKFIDGLEEIFADIRERHVDDTVCGLCEYDGAYIGQSGDWCNECPGFDKDDCFKLSDKCREKWMRELQPPSAQPEIIRCKDCKHCDHWYADRGRCFLWHETGISVFEDGYCNYAERRTDE